MKQGDLVTRNSYGGDIIFKVVDVLQHHAILKGYDFRLLADAPTSDLRMIEDVRQHRGYMQVQNRVQQMNRQLHSINQSPKTHLEPKRAETHPRRRSDNYSYFDVPGKVLHLDGDPLYLEKSMNLYKELRVPAEGHHATETNMPQVLYTLIPKVKPDILVITGHDGLLKNRRDDAIYSLNSYKNSIHFINAVQIARQYERSRDSLIIIAGACQSHFEALLQAGANFASSPARILIHALDPVYIAAKVSYTPFKETVNLMDIISHTISGLEGLGGIESRGSYRLGVPGSVVSQSGN